MARFSLLSCALVLACQQLPHGEVLVEVDTDVSVPRFASHLRVDLYTPQGGWYESQDFTLFHPEDWPASFSLYTDQPAGRSVRVRLRAYPEGAVRDYRGERFPAWPPFVEPSVATTAEELCATAPLLPMYQTLTLRRGGVPLTDPLLGGDCQAINLGGSVAVRIEVQKADTYRFEVVRAGPNGAAGIPAGDTLLLLRSSCTDRTTQLGCHDDIDRDQGNYLSRLVLPLAPGTYFLLTGTPVPGAPADLTLRWAPSNDWTGPPPKTAPPMEPENRPRLLREGFDVTPLHEPQPNLTIDRIVDLSIPYGARSTVTIRLGGECLGTQASLTDGTSCIDQAGIRLPASTPGREAGIQRSTSTAVGSWSGEQPVICSKTPRARSTDAQGNPLFDEEICIPGGAFTLGGRENIGAEDLNTFPEQVAVEPPFLLDRFEVTVGRYRQALRSGFQQLPSEDALVRNDGKLFAPTDYRRGCTWNGDADGPAPGIDRERLPLNCINWYNARALCNFFGGDLPSHTQWEYAAMAGRPDEPIFPWGNEEPDCARAVFGRAPGQPCFKEGPGPSPVDAKPWASSDVTALGVIGLAGSLAEWTRDSFRPYRDSCWWQRPLRKVGCEENDAPMRSQRGGYWNVPALGLHVINIVGQSPAFPTHFYGVRCAR